MSFRKVTYAKTHADIFIPGIGSLTQTLPPANKNIALEMFFTPDGLFIKAGFMGRSAEVIIPHANVALAVLGPEEPVKK